MAARVTEAASVLALATIVTLAMAAPVLLAPSERVFGMDIAGRHHDPFTVMRQFERPAGGSVYSQPVTDVAGAMLARVSSPVAAYNWLVLLSFPLSAVAAYLLGRHLALSRAAALFVAMAYAFSPFHLAQAAYHPHIAQTQWLPLYLLALWRCLDDASAAAVGFLAAATAAVTLSNFYGGLIAAVITPVAVGAYWMGTHRRTSGALRRLGLTAGALVLIAASGVAYAVYAAGPIVANRAAFGFPRADLFRYSAKWWSYLVPPVAHPLLGPGARRLWTAAGVREGLLEHQVSLGWAVVALGIIAVFYWWAEARSVGLSTVRLSTVGARPLHGGADCGGLLAGAGAEGRPVHDDRTIRSPLRTGSHVPVVCAIRGRGPVDDRPAGGHRDRRASARRHEERTGHHCRAPRHRRRRICGVAVCAVARRAADEGASLGRAAARPRARARLRRADAGVRVGSMADERSHHAAGGRDRRLPGTEPGPQARRERVLACDCSPRHAREPAVRRPRPAGRIQPGGAVRRRAGVRGDGPAAGHLHGHDDRLFSAGVRRITLLAVDGKAGGMDDREYRPGSDRRHARPRAVREPVRADGRAAGWAPSTNADRRAIQAHLPARPRHPGPRESPARLSCEHRTHGTRRRRRQW